MVIPVTIRPSLTLRRVQNWCDMPFCKVKKPQPCVELSDGISICEDCFGRVLRGEESL